MENQKYPQLLERIKAAFADIIILIGLMIIASSIFSSFEQVPDSARIAVFVFIFALYDPLFTSIFGGTIGHILMGLKVKQEKNPEKNIWIHLAIIRFLAKVGLGWISLLTVTGTEKKTAIHDSIVGSVVLYRS